MNYQIVPRFLILTLASGENERAECCRSVDAQLGVEHEHRVFEDLPKAEAHARLYRTIMAESGNFDLFLKLDGDMVLADDNALARIVSYFERVPELDHLVLGVSDWFTDSTIIGVHTFSSRVRWQPNPSGLFTDPDPVFPGQKLVIPDPQPLVVRHACDPSPLQAFYFGVHRAMKACQSGFGWKERQLFGARTNWHTLVQVWHHYQRCHDSRLGLALMGADLVLRGELPATAVNRQDPALGDAYRRASEMTSDEIDEVLGRRWARWPTRQLNWFRGMGWTMTLMVCGRSIRDGLTAPVRALRRARQDRGVHP